MAQQIAFRRGGDAAQQAAESSFTQRSKTQFFGLDNGQQEVLRYITDSPDWIWVGQHTAPTKPKPTDYEGNWPSAMPAVCRYDEAFQKDPATGKRLDPPIYSDCYICDAQITNQWGRIIKPTIRVWALACLRDEVIGNQTMVDNGQIEPAQVGKRIGYTDRMREIEETNDKGEPTGKKVMERALVVVNMAPSNYFNALQSMFGIYGTVCDRDYVVKCKGEKKDKTYDHIPLDPSGLKPGSEKWGRYEEAVKAQGLDLGDLVASRATDEFYARFFDPSKTVEKGKAGSGGKTSVSDSAVVSKASNEVSQSDVEAMRARVRSYAGAGAGKTTLDVD